MLVLAQQERVKMPSTTAEVANILVNIFYTLFIKVFLAAVLLVLVFLTLLGTGGWPKSTMILLIVWALWQLWLGSI